MWGGRSYPTSISSFRNNVIAEISIDADISPVIRDFDDLRRESIASMAERVSVAIMKGGKMISLSVVVACLAWSLPPAARAQAPAGIQVGRAMFLKGDYAECLELSRLAKPNDVDFQSFAALEIRTLLETGNVAEALKRGMILWRRAPFDPEVSLTMGAALRANGQATQAQAIMERALQVEPTPPVAGDSRGSVAYGELLLAAGLDAKDGARPLISSRRKKSIRQARDAYLAIGRLALAQPRPRVGGGEFPRGIEEVSR